MVKERIKQLLQEKLYNLDTDIDRIYKQFFKKSFSVVNSNAVIDTSELFKQEKFNTSNLKSPQAVEAHETNPCSIITNYAIGNFYKPFENLVGIGTASSIYGLLNGRSLSDVILELPSSQQESYRYEFSEHRIKASISHELAHWIDDTLNNKHITNGITYNTYTKGKNTGKNVNTLAHELHAQVHAIQQLKRKFLKTWDSITFDEMVSLSPSINNLNRVLKGVEKETWLKNLKIRLHREGLLGLKMR